MTRGIIFGLVTVFITACAGAQARAQHDFGLGIMAGEPTGIAFKSWLRSGTALAGGAAWSLDEDVTFQLHTDYLLHYFGVRRDQPRTLPLYYGVGGILRFDDDDTRFGVRVPLGAEYIFSGRRIDVFAEVVPVVDLIPGTEFRMNGAIGARYFF